MPNKSMFRSIPFFQDPDIHWPAHLSRSSSKGIGTWVVKTSGGKLSGHLGQGGSLKITNTVSPGNWPGYSDARPVVCCVALLTLAWGETHVSFTWPCTAWITYHSWVFLIQLWCLALPFSAREPLVHSGGSWQPQSSTGAFWRPESSAPSCWRWLCLVCPQCRSTPIGQHPRPPGSEKRSSPWWQNNIR